MTGGTGRPARDILAWLGDQPTPGRPPAHKSEASLSRPPRSHGARAAADRNFTRQAFTNIRRKDARVRDSTPS